MKKKLKVFFQGFSLHETFLQPFSLEFTEDTATWVIDCDRGIVTIIEKLGENKNRIYTISLANVLYVIEEIEKT